MQCTPNWSQTYTVKGTLYIPYAELKEPFYAWYDAKNGQSRIDYYGGMVKTYQLSGVTKYGTSLKVAPITTEHELNSDKCLQVNGSVEAKIEPQSVLPSLVGFECIGNYLTLYLQYEPIIQIFLFLNLTFGIVAIKNFNCHLSRVKVRSQDKTSVSHWSTEQC